MSFVVDAPIVRVHVVDADTGSYLKRTDHTSTGLRFLERQEQQSMLEAPGHETMTTVYQWHAHGAMEASPSILSHVPPIQTQAWLPLCCCLRRNPGQRFASTGSQCCGCICSPVLCLQQTAHGVHTSMRNLQLDLQPARISRLFPSTACLGIRLLCCHSIA